MSDDSAAKRDALGENGTFNHLTLLWNPATLEWYCRDCGRTSDHQDIKDARTEIALFPCLPPSP